MFLIRLKNGQEAQVDCEDFRMDEAIVRSGLTDPSIHVECASYLIGFRLTRVGKPLRPVAVALRDLNAISKKADGIIVMLTAPQPSGDPVTPSEGFRIYPTLPRQADASAVRALIEAAKAAEGPPRRLFFGRIEGAIRLIDVSTIYKAPRVHKPRPDLTTLYAPSETLRAGYPPADLERNCR